MAAAAPGEPFPRRRSQSALPSLRDPELGSP